MTRAGKARKAARAMRNVLRNEGAPVPRGRGMSRRKAGKLAKRWNRKSGK